MHRNLQSQHKWFYFSILLSSLSLVSGNFHMVESERMPCCPASLTVVCVLQQSGEQLHQGLEHWVSDNTGTAEWAMGNPQKWLYSSLSNLLGIGRNYYTLTLVFLLTHLSKSCEPALMGNLSLQSGFSVWPLGQLTVLVSAGQALSDSPWGRTLA